LLSSESNKVDIQLQLYQAFVKAQTRIQDCTNEETKLVAFALDLCAEFLTAVSTTQSTGKDQSGVTGKEMIAFSPM
jgi:hypothetical protein